jgi:NhaA family Na+:H+ antiporter
MWMTWKRIMTIPQIVRAASQKLFDYSLFLIFGSIAALLWANWDHAHHSHGYEAFLHFDLLALIPNWLSGSGGELHGHAAEHQAHGLTMHFVVNDILMALFFAIAAKEVWEAILPGGSLSSLKKAATPLIATVGGIAGPAIVYLVGAAWIGQFDALGSGWAIPCATDIAFSFLVARLIFGAGHPAISFLLLLAIADDAAGLAILAVFYPSGAVHFSWLLLAVAAVGCGLMMKKRGVDSFWWYLAIPGALSWFAFFKSGIHPALGLVPIIPTLPHAGHDLGLFADAESHRRDALSEFEHCWKRPVELILGLFALMNAGVVFSSIGAGSYLVMAGLFLGKPLGIGLCVLFATRCLKLELPAGMDFRHALIVGSIASLGFTVALFVSTAAFPTPGPIQDAAKMGAMASFLAPAFALLVSLLLGVRPACFRSRSTVGSAPRESFAH